MERSSRHPRSENNEEERKRCFSERQKWHTDKWTQADVVLLSDAGIRDCPSKPSRKLQGTGFLLLHRNSRELLAEASFFTIGQAKQVDVNMLELRAVQTVIGLMVQMSSRAQSYGPSKQESVTVGKLDPPVSRGHLGSSTQLGCCTLLAMMRHCLVLLLFQECGRLLNPWEIEAWAATETVLWNMLRLQRTDEEVYRRHCEMVEEGWFSD